MAANVDSESSRKRKRLRTEISRAFWCNPKENYVFEPATLRSVMRGEPTARDLLVR